MSIRVALMLLVHYVYAFCPLCLIDILVDKVDTSDSIISSNTSFHTIFHDNNQTSVSSFHHTTNSKNLNSTLSSNNHTHTPILICTQTTYINHLFLPRASKFLVELALKLKDHQHGCLILFLIFSHLSPFLLPLQDIVQKSCRYLYKVILFRRVKGYI